MQTETVLAFTLIQLSICIYWFRSHDYKIGITWQWNWKRSHDWGLRAKLTTFNRQTACRSHGNVGSSSLLRLCLLIPYLLKLKCTHSQSKYTCLMEVGLTAPNLFSWLLCCCRGMRRAEAARARPRGDHHISHKQGGVWLWEFTPPRPPTKNIFAWLIRLFSIIFFVTIAFLPRVACSVGLWLWF